MFLKNYQIKVVGELKRFFQTSRETKDAIDTARKALPENLRHTLNWVQSAFDSLHKPYNDSCVNGFGNYYPRVCIKVPTGGENTLPLRLSGNTKPLCAETHRACSVDCAEETIYTQTVRKLEKKQLSPATA